MPERVEKTCLGSKDLVKKVYADFSNRVKTAREIIGRPLTYAEKVLAAHLININGAELKRLQSDENLAPDRVALQDATAQMALLQFMSSGIPRVQVPSTVHCDHLIRAHTGAKDDLDLANQENKEVYDFLKSVSQKYGLGFWKPGAGIIHQVVLENYAFPGGMMIGTDSHTPNAGGLGMIAIGIGGADAVDVMAGQPFGLRWPGIIGVHLKGKLNGWAAAKDVILKVLDELTVKGGTGHIVEYFGEGTASISCTGKATICNMGAELGATTSLFPFDKKMAAYLAATDRADWAKMANEIAADLKADDDVIKSPQKYYNKIVEINLDTLEPHIVGPHTPDLARPVSAFAKEIKEKGYPEELKYALIGSCTNSSYEDMDRSASIVKDAQAKGLKLNSPLMISPGSEHVFNTIRRDGQKEAFDSIGATVLAFACGPCIGQWQRDDIKRGDKNSIITSFNRNFKARNDGNPETLSFISSPELVTAMAIAGRLSFNPITDTIKNNKGEAVKLSPPVGNELPAKNFDTSACGLIEPAADGSKIEVAISPQSKRIERLEPFKPWDGKDYTDLPILLKASGKCTTDHISPAGPWLKFRGHLNNISDNMFIGATNAFSGETGVGQNVITKETSVPFAQIARSYKSQNIGWVVIGDENYGEGSSREHAAMEPRLLNGKAVIVKSFARIHETNLKKQGVLPLVFVNPSDYDKFQLNDRVSVVGLDTLAPKKPLTIVIRHEDGSESKIEVKHTLTVEQIQWFRAGSALNKIAAEIKK
ncbi:MAG: aconitate hydratase [Deltaproteobacteria bacterium]|nr:aconitate hydratase [Deltaproteobacteria bacterium]